MDWKALMDNTRKNIINGGTSAMTAKPTPPPAPEKTKLEIMLEERRARQEPKKEPEPPKQSEQKPEDTKTEPETPKEPEPPKTEVTTPQTPTQPEKVSIDMTSDQLDRFMKFLDNYETKTQEPAPEQKTETPQEPTKQPDTPKEPEPPKEPETPTQQTTQEPEQKTEQETPSEPVTTSETTEPEALDNATKQRIMDNRNALKKNNGSFSVAPIGDVFANRCTELGIPKSNHQLLMSAAMIQGKPLDQESLDNTIKEVVKENPILSRSTQIPGVVGGTNVTPVENYSGLSLEQRAAAIKEKVKNL